MPALRIFFRNLAAIARSVFHLGSYAVMFVCALVLPRAKTAATIVALRSQLATRTDRVHGKQEPKPRFTPAFRLLWVVLSRFLEGWEDLAQRMKPATVMRWHRAAFRLYWRWRSRKRGRPPISVEMQRLIRKLSRENPLWTAEQIRDTLLLLGHALPCEPANGAA